jgi:biotin-(acetyl-CoA carboxylase) ligase
VALLRELDQRLTQPHELSAEHLRREWLERAEPMERCISLQHAGRVFTGTMIDVDPGAALVVRLDEGGVRAFDAATTTIVHENPMAKIP